MPSHFGDTLIGTDAQYVWGGVCTDSKWKKKTHKKKDKEEDIISHKYSLTEI